MIAPATAQIAIIIAAKGKIMKKYQINKDFNLVSLLTFPVIPAVAPIAEVVLGTLVNEHHSDKYISVKKYKIKVNKGEISVLVFEPKNESKKLPALFYLHGGGFIYKAAPYHYTLAKAYSRYAKCKVVMPDYRLTPKYSHPIAFNDCVDSLKWTIENSDKLNIDKSKIAIGGDSAGGCLAAATTLFAKNNGIDLCAQMLVYPVLDCEQKTDSIKKYTNTPVWNSKLNKKMWQLYLNGNTDIDEYASPSLATDFTNMPKTYIETAEFDCLSDEGKNYAKKLFENGCDVETFDTKGTIHGFDMAGKSKIVTESIGKRCDFLRKSFK